MIPMDSLPSKMDEADKHLDRLGGILRSLRGPPADRPIPSDAVRRDRQQLRDCHQQQQQQQQQQRDRELDERRLLLCASGSSQSRTASQSSQTEILAAVPPLQASRREDEAERGSFHKGAPTPQQQYQRLGDNKACTVPGHSAPSSYVPQRAQAGVAGAETDRGDGGGGNEIATKAPPSLLRERAVRTWWRGLSCGVCFAGGAWAREGHGIYGVVLALVAVCGEAMLCPVA